MLGQKYTKHTIGIVLTAFSLLASPADAHLNPPQATHSESSLHGRVAPEGSLASMELPGLYLQLSNLLGKKFYGYLLQNDEFIVFQDLVITHIEKRYPVYASTH